MRRIGWAVLAALVIAGSAAARRRATASTLQDLRGETYIEGGKLLTESESLARPFRSGIPPDSGIETLAGVVD